MLRLPCVRTPKNHAQALHHWLVQNGLLHPGYKAARDARFVYFPLAQKPARTRPPAPATLTTRAFEPHPRPVSFTDRLRSLGFSDAQLAQLQSSFDVVGDIAILQIPAPLLAKKRAIAQALLATHPGLRTVARKKGGRAGAFRVTPLETLAGERRTTTTHRESGCAFRLDLARVYFSPRLGTERARLAARVKPNERVLALFAGVGPFPIVAAKKLARDGQRADFAAVELNPVAAAYLKENIALNNVGDQVRPVQGDVKRVLARPAFRAWADRAFMPLPHSGVEFLDAVLRACRDGATVHYYGFVSTAKGVKNPFAPLEQQVRDACRRNGKTCRVVRKKIVRPYAPRVDQAVLDVRVQSARARPRVNARLGRRVFKSRFRKESRQRPLERGHTRSRLEHGS